MNLLMNRIAQLHDFTDYELKVIRFYILGFLYDISKIIAIGIFFGCIGKFPEFLFTLIPLLFLRKNTGGYHLKTYFTCFLASVLYFILAILVLPAVIPMKLTWMQFSLLICVWVIYRVGPISSNREIVLNKRQLHKVHLHSFQIVFVISVLLFLFPETGYLKASFWTVVLHSVQLMITKIKKRGERDEKVFG
ncbi:MAG: accessory gene regulator B family protein [Clostridiales bacterium]|nr:accessory gene regulator B family protein [Clostridiales bacterium]